MLFSISLCFHNTLLQCPISEKERMAAVPSNDNFLIFHLPDIRHLFQTAQHIFIFDT